VRGHIHVGHRSYRPWGTVSCGRPLAAVRFAAVSRFPSLKAKQLMKVLSSEPLGYRVVRQKGSHRKLQAPGRPALTFAFHDSQTIRPGTVKDILCNQVGLAEEDALALL
jgi:predicted RNA binding protein YcfA (HicA-like mRNA interferase family)